MFFRFGDDEAILLLLTCLRFNDINEAYELTAGCQSPNDDGELCAERVAGSRRSLSLLLSLPPVCCLQNNQHGSMLP
jgi:hypothetical protein